MKKSRLWILLILGLFLAIGGLVASKFSLIDFILNPAGVLGVMLLVWAFIVKKNKKSDSKKG